MRLVVIADDLTGALDSAVAFANSGLHTVCARTVDTLEAALALGAEVVAVSTGSREVPEAEAVARVAEVRRILEASPLGSRAKWFKKIDSRMKGHVAAEIRALLAPGQGVVVSPAIPKLGRFVVDGMVTGFGVSAPIPVAELCGVDDRQIIDAKSDNDLSLGLARVPDGAMLVGAAGLADAVARDMTGAALNLSSPPLPAPAIFAIGSRDPVTLAQLGRFDLLSAPNGTVPDPVAPDRPVQVIQLTQGAENEPSDVIGARFADGISRWVRATMPATLLASGGETAAAIMGRLGIGVLEVVGEALPGLPVSRALDGVPGLVIVTKSGGFGTEETLVNLADKLVK